MHVCVCCVIYVYVGARGCVNMFAIVCACMCVHEPWWRRGWLWTRSSWRKRSRFRRESPACVCVCCGRVRTRVCMCVYGVCMCVYVCFGELSQLHDCISLFVLNFKFSLFLSHNYQCTHYYSAHFMIILLYSYYYC